MKENRTATNKTESKKNSSSSSFTSRLKIIIFIGVIAYAVFMIINQQITLNQLREKQQQLLEEKAQLEADKNYYENELKYIDSDEYIIKEAKERLGWLFDDETKYVIEDDSKKEP